MRKLLGGILLAIGILIAGASGLCSAIFFVLSLTSPGGGEGILIVLIGGVPFAIGLGLFFAGRGLIRSAQDTDTQ